MVLSAAATAGKAFYGFTLLLVYSAGLGIPFFITSLAINSFLSHFSSIMKYMKVVKILSGLLLIIFGVILLTDRTDILLGLVPDLGIEEKLLPTEIPDTL